MNNFIIKSISLSQKKVENIEIKELPLWGSMGSSHYGVQFQYQNTTLYITYTHRDWKGKLVDQIVKEIDNKIKEFENEKQEVNEEKQITRIQFALDIKLKMQLTKAEYNKIIHNKTMENKIEFVRKKVKSYKRRRYSQNTLKSVYENCMQELYNDLTKNLKKVS